MSNKIKTLSYDEYEKRAISSWIYQYKSNKTYFKEVIKIITENKDSIRTVLELGPDKHTIVENSDIMTHPNVSVFGRPESFAPKEYIYDAQRKPWPIKDKQYDLFIALQVWEHLDGRQSQAFREVMRISKMAILSFPYLWPFPKGDKAFPVHSMRSHHMIDKQLISDWTLNISPQKIKQVESKWNLTGPDKIKGILKLNRIIYFWKF